MNDSFVIRDKDTGKVIMTQDDMITRYAGTLVVPVNFTGILEFRSDAFLTGVPFYIYDYNSNVHYINYAPWGNAVGSQFYVTCEFVGNLAKANIQSVGGANNGKWESYIHFGTY